MIYPFPDGFLPCPQFVFYLIYLTFSHFQHNYLLFIIVFGGPEDQTHIVEQAKKVTSLLSYILDSGELSLWNQKTIHKLPNGETRGQG